MNTLNRVLVVVLLVGLVAILVAGLTQPGATIDVARHGVDALQAFVATNYSLYLMGGAAKLLLAIILLGLELRRPRRLTVRVQQASGSSVELSTESVSRGLEYHLAQVPGVTRVRPRVVSTGKAVRLALDMEIDPAVDVPGKSEEVLQLAREIIEGKLGLKLASASANVRQAAYVADVAPVATRKDPGADLPTEGRPPSQLQ